MSRNYTIENAEIFWKNFSGKGSTYNSEGSRNFCVYIPEEDAEDMKADGWNIKYSKPRDDGEEPRPYVQVAVAYGQYPPKIYMVTSKNKTLLDEDTVDELDRAEIEHVDLIINPYRWKMRTKNGEESGVKAYCKTMYVTIEEDFGGRYSDYSEDELPFGRPED